MWHESDDVERYLDAVGPLLLPEPGLNTIALTVCANTRARPDGTRFAWWQEPSGGVTGAVSHTPSYPVVLSAVPDHAIASLVDLWAPEGVNGPTEVAVQVAAVCARRQGRRVVVHHPARLFRLGSLITPDVPGRARFATEDDIPLLVAWFEAFMTEADAVGQEAEPAVRDRLSYSGYLLWEDSGPVALAGHTREAFGGIRLGPVYTPPEHRCHGYGAAVTAAVSQRALDVGAREVVLFTDLTNPTSNALYPRLGYQPVTDRVLLQLD